MCEIQENGAINPKSTDPFFPLDRTPNLTS